MSIQDLYIQAKKDHRERIAIKAMVAILGNPSYESETVFESNEERAKFLAKHCYSIADAMIEQKNKFPSNSPPSNE